MFPAGTRSVLLLSGGDIGGPWRWRQQREQQPTRVTTAAATPTATATATAIRVLCVCATVPQRDRERQGYQRGKEIASKGRQEVGYLHSNPKTSHNFRQQTDTVGYVEFLNFSSSSLSVWLSLLRLYRLISARCPLWSFDKVARRPAEGHLISDNLALESDTDTETDTETETDTGRGATETIMGQVGRPSHPVILLRMSQISPLKNSKNLNENQVVLRSSIDKLFKKVKLDGLKCIFFSHTDTCFLIRGTLFFGVPWPGLVWPGLGRRWCIHFPHKLHSKLLNNRSN